MFWDRFLHEYLPVLKVKKKQEAGTKLQAGNVVIILQADNTPRSLSFWLLWRVIAHFAAKDGINHSGKLKLPNSKRKTFKQSYQMEINARFDKYVLGQCQHEYLPVLNVQKKKKSRNPERNFKQDDIVILQVDNTPRLFWLLSRLIACFAGKDEINHSVKWKFPNSVFFEQPTKYLCWKRATDIVRNRFELRGFVLSETIPASLLVCILSLLCCLNNLTDN